MSGFWSRPSDPTNDSQDLVGLFSATADELAANLETYQRNFAEVAQHLNTVERTANQQLRSLMERKSGNSIGMDDPTREVDIAMAEFAQSLEIISEKVNKSRQGVQKLQLGYFMSAPGNGGQRNAVYLPGGQGDVLRA